MAKFTDFVLKLGSDPSVLQKMKTDPDATLNEAGLTTAEKDLLLKGDPDAIRLTIAEELGVDSSIIKPFFTITATLVHVHVNVNVTVKQI